MNIFHARENDMTRGFLSFSRVVEARNGTIFRFDVVVDRFLFFELLFGGLSIRCVHVLIRAELEEGEIHLVVSQMNEILEMV